MPSTYTSSLRLTLPATGENSGSWGGLVNTGITELTDAAIAGYVSIAMTDADYTLTSANGATDEARRMMLNMTGTLTAARNVICPTASKLYIIKNATTGGFAITLKTSGGTGISIPNGSSMLLMCNGTNVVDAVTQFSSGAFTNLSYTGTLTGGTGVVNLGSGQFYKDASGNVGIGTIPSAWQSIYKAFDIGNSASIWTSTSLNNAIVSNNAYINSAGNFVYKTSSFATGYSQNELGQHRWLIAPTGTAGNTFSFTAAMTLDASGNLGIGTSSPSYKLDAQGANNIIRSKGTSGYGAFYADGATGSTAFYFFAINGTETARISSQSTNYIAFSTNDTTISEKMRITQAGDVGIGTSSPGAILHTVKTSAGAATVGAFLQNSDATTGTEVRLAFAANANVLSADRYGWIGYVNTGGTNGGALTFATTPGGAAATERMRLDSSGNLGIGNTNPAAKLDVVGNQANFTRYSTDATPFYTAIAKYRGTAGTPVTVNNGDNIGQQQFYAFDGAAIRNAVVISAEVDGVPATSTVPGRLTFFTTPAGASQTPLERMRLDSSGNLGLGVTPSAWASSGNLQLQGNIAFSAGFNIASNAYFGSGSVFRYINTAVATSYSQASGQHIWYSAASGTAGNAVSFATNMVLDVNGVLSLQGSGGQANWRKYSTDNAPYYHALLKSRGTTGAPTTVVLSDTIGQYQFFGYNGTNDQTAAAIIGRVSPTGTVSATSMPGQLEFYTTPDGSNSSVNRLTIDQAGNVGIGTTSPIAKLSIENSSAGDGLTVRSNGFNTNKAGANNSLLLGCDYSTAISYVVAGGSSTNTTLAFYTAAGAAPVERARITSGGDLLVGTTTSIAANYRLQAASGASSCGVFQTTSTTAYPTAHWNAATSGDNLFAGFFTEGTATLRGSIDYNRTGGLTRYNTTSDYRAKDILGPVQNPGATIDALKVYEGIMKGATQSRPMLIAHEAQEHAPYAVSGVKDEVNEDGSPKYQQIDVSSLVPLLLAEIQSLRARVASLENQP